MSFSPTAFLKALSAGVLPSEEDEEQFELFTTQMALENDVSATILREKTNTEAYYKLSKKLQAHSFDSLLGKRIYMSFNPNRNKRIDELKKQIEGYMSEFSLDYQTAKSIVKHGK